MSTKRIREALECAKDVLEPEEMAGALGEADGLDAFVASSEPSRLEMPEPVTLDEALASLRLWRASARRLLRRLEAVTTRANDATGIVRVWAFHHGTETGVRAVANWVATGNTTGDAEGLK